MQVVYKSVLAFKNCQAVFRSHSSGALPVLAITGWSSVETGPFLDLWESSSGAPLGASGGASLGALLGLCGGFCESSLGHILGQAR